MQIALDLYIYVDVNSSCYVYVNAINTEVKIYLGKIRQLAKNLPEVPISDWVSGLFFWIPQGMRSILSIKVSVATPTSYCCTKVADQGIAIWSIQDSEPELGNQVFLIQYPFLQIETGLYPISAGSSQRGHWPIPWKTWGKRKQMWGLKLSPPETKFLCWVYIINITILNDFSLS